MNWLPQKPYRLPIFGFICTGFWTAGAPEHRGMEGYDAIAEIFGGGGRCFAAGKRSADCGRRVCVNGEVASIGQSVDEGDRVELDGSPVEREQRHVVILFYKPRGVVCTSEDPEGAAPCRTFFGICRSGFIMWAGLISIRRACCL